MYTVGVLAAAVEGTADGYVRVSRTAGREGESFISPEVQRQRLAGRGMAAADIERRLAAQGSDLAERLAARADRRIDAEASRESIRERVEDALADVLAPRFAGPLFGPVDRG